MSSFSTVLQDLKNGMTIYRVGWRNHATLTLVQPTRHDPFTKPFMALTTTDGHRTPWTPTNDDLMAIDWEVWHDDQRQRSKEEQAKRAENLYSRLHEPRAVPTSGAGRWPIQQRIDDDERNADDGRTRYGSLAEHLDTASAEPSVRAVEGCSGPDAPMADMGASSGAASSDCSAVSDTGGSSD